MTKKSSKPRQPRCAHYVVDSTGKVHGRGASSPETLARRAKKLARKGLEVQVVQLCSGERRRALRSGVLSGTAGTPAQHRAAALMHAGAAVSEAQWGAEPDEEVLEDEVDEITLAGARPGALRAGAFAGLGAAPTKADVDAFWANAPRWARDATEKASKSAQQRMFERERPKRETRAPRTLPGARPSPPKVDEDLDIEQHYRRARHL